MAREFTRNMLIMLSAIMVGVVVITFFAADIINRSKIETLTTQHNVEIGDINSNNENFTNNFLQGSVKMDAAREIREIGNLRFDFARLWYSNALANQTKNYTKLCVENCTLAMTQYLAAYDNFFKSKPYFEQAQTFTKNLRYLEALKYYIGFAQAGQNISIIRYNMSDYLRKAAENLSFGHLENATKLMENFTMIENGAYQAAQQQYQEYRGKIDGYLFFSEIREIPDQ